MTKARNLYNKYPLIFSAMFEHSFREDPEHPDDIGVIYSKLSANAHGKQEPYWVPAHIDVEPIYEEIRDLDCEGDLK